MNCILKVIDGPSLVDQREEFVWVHEFKINKISELLYVDQAISWQLDIIKGYIDEHL